MIIIACILQDFHLLLVASKMEKVDFKFVKYTGGCSPNYLKPRDVTLEKIY